MNSQQQLEQAFARLTSSAEGESATRIQTAGGTYYLNVVRCDSLSCELSRIAFESSTQSSRRDWRAAAEEIARRVRYLPEPIQLIEFDDASQTSLIRSTPPKRITDANQYFECLASPSAVELRRYQTHPGGRTAISFCLTREMLLQLAVDLCEAATESAA